MKKYIVWLIVFSFLLSSCGIEIHSQIKDEAINEIGLNTNSPERKMGFDYEDHDAIFIWDDSDLSGIASEGDGTVEFPYVIEGWSIKSVDGSEVGIEIRDTTKSFVIRNCWIEGNMEGIHIERVAPSTINITNNVIIDSLGTGIAIFDSTDITVIVNDNICSFNGQGILLDDTLDIVVQNNTCNNNRDGGIFLYGSLVALVQNNTCNYNGEDGIRTWDSDLYSSFSENICIGNGEVGLNFWAVSEATILSNTICDNNLEGIFMEACSNNLISDNNFTDNTNYGIKLWYGVDYNDIHHNYFYNNNVGGTSQACDDEGNTWYDTVTSEGNYWKNWFNGDYPIDGLAGRFDIYPLDLDSPEIDRVSDIECVYGTLGNIIRWNVSDLNPTIYFVYKDFVEILSGSWTNDIPIIISLDGLDTGTYIYQLFVIDGLGRPSLDTVIVNVTYAINEFNGAKLLVLFIAPSIAVIWLFKRRKRYQS